MRKLILAMLLAVVLDGGVSWAEKNGIDQRLNSAEERLIPKYLPYLLVNNDWDCYIAIQNYGNAEAMHSLSTTDHRILYVTAYDNSGTQVGSSYTGAIIPVNGMVLLDARTIFGDIPADGAMMVAVTSSYNSLKIMGIMTNKSTLEKNNFMLEETTSPSGQTLIIPEFIDNTNYKTTLVICNTGTSSDTVAVTARDSTGITYTKSEIISGKGFKVADSTSWFASPSFAGKEGWLKAFATNNPIIGAVIYTNATAGRNTKSMVSLMTITRTGSLTEYIPMSVSSPDIVSTCLKLVNNMGTAVDVMVSGFKQDGTVLGTPKTIKVTANGYVVATIDKMYFSDTTDMPTYFTLKITSPSTEVYAMATYVFSGSYTKSAGDFVIANPVESYPTSTLNIPFYLTISPYQNYLFVQNTGTASNSVTITAYKSDGKSAGTITKSILAHGLEIFLVNDFAPNSFGSIKISGGSGILCTSVNAYSDGSKEIWGGYNLYY